MAVQRDRGMAALLAEQKHGGKPPGLAPKAPPASQHPAGLLTVSDVPDPHDPSPGDELTAADAAELQACELALDNARLAFAAAGKALETVSRAKLYRGRYGTFEAYAEDRWGISRQTAYRWIAAWPLAARLAPIGDKLNEAQVRELLPLAKDHGEDAAVTAYRTVTEADGVTVTAQLLRDIVDLLADDYDPATAEATIRAWLAGDRPDSPPRPSVDPAQAITRGYERVVERRLSRLAKSDPKAARAALSELQDRLEELARKLPV